MEIIRKPHFVLIPWLAPSHMIPMADIACLLAAHDAPVTIITTPANTPLIQRCVEAVAQPSAGAIAVVPIPFPAAEAGLPEGCERMDHIPSAALVPNFFNANKQFGEAVAQYLIGGGEGAVPRPSCIIAGMCHPRARGMAHELGIPCLIFHGFGSFALLCCEYLHKHKPHKAAASVDEPFDVPVLPFECKLARRQRPLQFQSFSAMLSETVQEMRDFELAVDGIVVNSFEELEHGSVTCLGVATGKRVHTIGPVSLCHEPGLDVNASEDAKRCMAWLDSMEAKSVVYVSFGSAGYMSAMQLVQLGMALLACPWPILWVIKGADSLPEEAAKWLQENTDTPGATGRKCLVVRGWAPQVAILAHPAVGGFMTHCGWGSTLESVAAGVPMATWPFFAEQFINEKLIVDVLGIGVSVGVTKPTENMVSCSDGKDGDSMAKAKSVVGMEEVKKALERLMDGGDEGEKRRKRAQKLKVRAKESLEKGGSSYMNLERLIQSCV